MNEPNQYIGGGWQAAEGQRTFAVLNPAAGEAWAQAADASRGDARSAVEAASETFIEQRWITLERGGRHYPPPFTEKR